jgi:CRP-like cAMP-binding protein
MPSHARGSRLSTRINEFVSQSENGLDSIGSTAKYDRGETILIEGKAATFWYRMIAGAALCSTVCVDGRRRIVDLLLPGNFFGFAAGQEYDCTAEAIIDGTETARYDRCSADALADRNPTIARDIRNSAIEAMDRRRTQLLVAGRTTAQQKVASFLIEMAERTWSDQPDEVRLPVSRYDIADYLGISTETVSRSFSALQRNALIEIISPHHIRILDRDALEACDWPRSQCLSSLNH